MAFLHGKYCLHHGYWPHDQSYNRRGTYSIAFFDAIALGHSVLFDGLRVLVVVGDILVSAAEGH